MATARALQIVRVVLCARVPTDFTPGWRAAQMVEVHLEPENAEAMPAALQAGWKPV